MTERQAKQHKVGIKRTDGPEGKNAALTQKGKAITGERIFVMDAKGKIYAADDQIHGKNKLVKDSSGRVVDMHHSSMLSGKAVAGAGEMRVESGKLKAISDGSGHYRPGDKHTNQVLHRLEKKGVSLDNVTFFSEHRGVKGMAKEYQQGGTTDRFVKRHAVIDEMNAQKQFKVDPSKRSKGAQMFAKARAAADASPDNSGAAPVKATGMKATVRPGTAAKPYVKTAHLLSSVKPVAKPKVSALVAAKANVQRALVKAIVKPSAPKVKVSSSAVKSGTPAVVRANAPRPAKAPAPPRRLTMGPRKI